MTASNTPPGIWIGQILHFGSLAILLVLLWLTWAYLGKPFPAAFWIAAAFPVVHQAYVWLAWRLELRSSAVSTSIGFHAYVVVFFLLLACFGLEWLQRRRKGLS